MFVEDYITNIIIRIDHQDPNTPSETLYDGLLEDLPFFDIRPRLAPGTITLALHRHQEPLCYLGLRFDGNIAYGMFDGQRWGVTLEDLKSGWNILPPAIMDYIWKFNQ